MDLALVASMTLLGVGLSEVSLAGATIVGLMGGWFCRHIGRAGACRSLMVVRRHAFPSAIPLFVDSRRRLLSHPLTPTPTPCVLYNAKGRSAVICSPLSAMTPRRVRRYLAWTGVWFCALRSERVVIDASCIAASCRRAEARGRRKGDHCGRDRGRGR